MRFSDPKLVFTSYGAGCYITAQPRLSISTGLASLARPLCINSSSPTTRTSRSLGENVKAAALFASHNEHSPRSRQEKVKSRSAWLSFIIINPPEPEAVRLDEWGLKAWSTHPGGFRDRTANGFIRLDNVYLKRSGHAPSGRRKLL